MKTIGIGIQDFAKIADKNMFYIDKTAFLKEWWENQDSVTLITRPRRFGKTLLMSMTDYFFSVNHSDCKKYFEGLDIWKEEKFRELQGTYPVIFMSFADIKGSTYEKTRMGIIHKITKLYTDFEFLKRTGVLSGRDLEFYDSVSVDMGDDVAGIAIQYMCDYLRRYYGKNALVLLDEYDTPLQEAYVNDYWKELADFIRSLFNSTFKTNPYLERGLLTGITRVSKESIFSDLNNLEVVTTTSEKYSTSFGFTEKEVFQVLENNRLSSEKENIRYWYDGFSFGKRKDIYNPWSITKYLDTGEYGTYWADTSGNVLVSNLIRQSPAKIKSEMEDLLQGRTICTDLDYMNQFMNQVALQTFSSFDTGNKPSEEQEPERFYHGFVLGLIVDLAEKYRITSNRESGFGRYDVVMEPLKENLDAIVMEFKVQNMTKEKSLEQTVENALRQINEKEYDTELLARGIKKERIRHYGFAFRGKKVLIGTEE